VVADCPFCSPQVDPLVVVSDEHCVGLLTRDGPAGGAIVVPRAHRSSPLQLTDAELISTRDLLSQLRDRALAEHAPDGWNIGWNLGSVGGQEVEHVHCHLVPRFADETFAGRGLRWWIKQPENKRVGRS